MKLSHVFLATAAAVVIAGCGSDSDDFNPTSEKARYELSFDTVWNQTNFPTNYPANRHFSPLIGLTHNDTVNLFKVGENAIPGVVSVAETGGTTIVEGEIGEIQNAGNSGYTISGGGIPMADDDVDVEFDISQDHPLVSVVTMLAPSPDWFTGVDSVNLYENGKWVEKLEVQVLVYDAGSDSGVSFMSENAKLDPAVAISKLSTSRAETDFEAGVNYATQLHIGTMTFERID